MDLSLRKLLVDEDQANTLRMLAGSESPIQSPIRIGKMRRIPGPFPEEGVPRDRDLASQLHRGVMESFGGPDAGPLSALAGGIRSFFRGDPITPNEYDEFGNLTYNQEALTVPFVGGAVAGTLKVVKWLTPGSAKAWLKGGAKVGAAPGGKLLAKTARRLQTQVVALAKQGKGTEAAKDLVAARKEIKAWTKVLDESGKLSDNGKKLVEEALEETKKTAARARGKFYTEKAVEKVDDVATRTDDALSKTDDLLDKADDVSAKADDIVPKIDPADIPKDPVKAKGFFSRRWETIKSRKIKGNILPALNVLTSAMLLKDGLDWVQESLLGSPDKELQKASQEQKKLLEDTPLAARQREREQQSEAVNVGTAAAGLDQIARKILLQRKVYAPSLMSMVAPQTEDDVIDHAARNEILKSLIAGNKAELQNAKQEADR